jgi:hypothetical protein
MQLTFKRAQIWQINTDVPLIKFWATLKVEFSYISAITVKKPLYLLRNNVLTIRSEYRNKLHTEHDMKIQLSTSAPDFNVRMTSKKCHPVAGCCEHGDEHSGSIKGAEFTD